MPQNTTGVTTNGLAALDFTISERNETAHQWGRFLTDPGTVALSSAVLQHERIAVDQNILSGEPYVRGTRIPIAAILDGLGEGLTPEELIEHCRRACSRGSSRASIYRQARPPRLTP